MTAASFRRSARLPGCALALVMVFTACTSGGSGGTAAGGDPGAGGWKTWVLSSGRQIKVPPPPSGQKASADAAEVRRLAAEPTDEATKQIEHWDQEPAGKPWHELNLELVAASVKDPPLASRGYALMDVALYDTVVATWHWKYEYKRTPPDGAPKNGDLPYSYPSEHAALAGAASRILAYLFPDRPGPRLEQMAEEAAASRVRAGANFPSDVQAGLELGRQVAAKVIERAKLDGSDRAWDGKRPPGIGRGPEFWEPPPQKVTPPTSPLAGTWKTWVLTSGAQFRSAPPPAFGSPEHRRQVDAVISTKQQLTEDQKRIARFWAGGLGTPLPPGQWHQIALIYIGRARLNLPRAARAMALVGVALADAGVAVWDTKFTYWSARPESAIRDLGIDPSWTPLIPSPSFPSYQSGHSGYSGATSEVLAHLFPDQAKVFRAKAEEAAESRLYGGIHYPIDNEVGLRLGRQIGRLVVARAKADGAEL
ncbi:MAG: phosphatase PAP2 family protein [Actinomycetota bacterium]